MAGVDGMNEKQQVTVYQHFVPQFYMKYWGSGDKSKHLWQYIKASNMYAPCNTDDKNCCSRRYLYELSNLNIATADTGWLSKNYLEKAFSENEREWADKFRILFDKLDSGSFISNSDSVLICEFVANLCVRNPVAMKSFDWKIEEIVANLLSAEELKPVWAIMDKLSLDYVNMYLRPSIEKQILLPNKVAHLGKPSGPIEGSVYGDYLNKLRHDRMFLLCSKNEVFVFSDMPVLHVCFTDLKYMACPLSPKYAVLFIPRKYVNKWVSYNNQFSNRLNFVTDKVACDCFFPYLGSRNVSKIYGRSEKELHRMVMGFDAQLKEMVEKGRGM